MAERVIYSIIFSFDDWSWDLMGKAYLVRANPFRNRQAWRCDRVKSVLSGLMSSSGVLSRQSMPRTSKVASLRSTRVAMVVPIGLGRAGERSENVPRAVPSFAGDCMTRSRRERCSQ
jgi:hypothetical protein